MFTKGEALTNMMWARITSLGDIKASCNWMWAAKLDGEGPKVSSITQNSIAYFVAIH